MKELSIEQMETGDEAYVSDLGLQLHKKQGIHLLVIDRKNKGKNAAYFAEREQSRAGITLSRAEARRLAKHLLRVADKKYPKSKSIAYPHPRKKKGA